MGLTSISERANAQGTPDALLEYAMSEVAANSSKFIALNASEVLATKLSILQSHKDAQQALNRARAIENPFYSALAIGGIAATEMRSAPSASTNHFCEALITSRSISHWTGSHATSLCFLFELLPFYPKEEASLLLGTSKETFDAWKASDYQKGQALLAFAKATTSVSPTNATSLLFDVAIKSNHYWDSIEYLAGFIAKQSPDKTLRLAEAHYQASRDWPNDQYFLRAVLIERAKKDFGSAFHGIMNMRDLDREIAAVELAEAMLAAKRQREAEEVIAYIGGLKTDFAWTKESLNKLRRRLAEKAQNLAPTTNAAPELIEQFLKVPSSAQLQSLAEKASITFRDKQQALAFVTTALPLAETFRDMGYPHHGSPRSTVFGLLVLCSAAAEKTDTALEIARRINIPELRVSYLLDAYEQIKPLPASVSDWPIHFWKRTSVSIQEHNRSTMTLFHEVFTPGRPLYWVMLCVPNGLVLLWAVVKAFRYRRFLLVAAAAVLNVAPPWMMHLVFIRGNGLNAPDSPHWFIMLAVALAANVQTICLLLLLPVLTRKSNSAVDG